MIPQDTTMLLRSLGSTLRFIVTMALSAVTLAIALATWIGGNTTLMLMTIGVLMAGLSITTAQYHDRKELYLAWINNWKWEHPEVMELVRTHISSKNGGEELLAPVANEIAKASIIYRVEPAAIMNLAAQYFQLYDQRNEKGMPLHGCPTCLAPRNRIPTSLCPNGLRMHLTHWIKQSKREEKVT